MADRPPGFVSILKLVRKHGAAAVQRDLYHGRQQAFRYDPRVDDLEEVAAKEWAAPDADVALLTGRWLTGRWLGSDMRVWDILILEPSDAADRTEAKERDPLIPQGNAQDLSASSVDATITDDLTPSEKAVADAIKKIWPAGLPVGLKAKARNCRIREHLPSDVDDRTIQRAIRKLKLSE